MGSPRYFPTFFLLLLTAVGASRVDAQTVRGTVTDAEAGTPVAGAAIVLVDSTGTGVGGGFADAAGAFLVRAPAPGRYTLRVQRIGFRDVDSEPFELAAGQTLELPLRAPREAVALAPITAQARRQCVVQPAEGEALAIIWGEARKALHATALAEEQALYSFAVRRHRRHLELPSLRVARDSTRTSVGVSDGSPFISLPPEQLLSAGFIEHEESGTLYYAPDAHVLLSDEFSQAYCFRLTENRRESLLGIQFEPATRTGPPAIRGTIWLNSDSLTLRHVDYRYARAELPDGSADLLGGRLEFESLPSGAWMVRSWYIRMPVVVEQEFRVGGGPLHRRQVLAALTEEGGVVTNVTATDGDRVGGFRLARLSGVVYDSVAGAPLRGASVFLDGTAYVTQTDAAGAFVLDELPAGEFGLSFTHPTLNVYGVLPPGTPVSLAAGTTQEIHLAIPAALAETAGNRCTVWAADRRPGESAVLLGRARDEFTGVPLGGADVLLSWQREAGADSTRMRVSTDADGMYVACGVPADRPVTARVQYLGRTGAGTTLAAAAETGFAEHDITLRIAQHGQLVLHLVDWESGQPIDNAIVHLPDSNRRLVSGRDGVVRIDSLARGEHRIEVEHVAYGTFRETVDVADAVTQMDVRIPARAVALDAIEVRVRPALSALETARRSRGSRADIMTREDIEPLVNTARHVGDLLTRFPGLRVAQTEHGNTGMRRGLCIESARGVDNVTGDCAHVGLVLDGIMIPTPVGDASAFEALIEQLNVAAIESIEYLPAAEAGPRFGTGTRSGVLIIYTRGNGPYAKPML